MNNKGSPSIDYKTHILIGVRVNGVMTVISDWPHVPTQAEVQQEIAAVRDGYVTFALCTPTSIMPVNDESGSGLSGKPRSGRWA